MLSRLVIRNIVLIEALDLDLDSGFTVLTGETGAGKSILLDALDLALGGKADGKLVRRGEDKGSVSATFLVTPTHPALHIIEEAGFEADDGVVILRRTLTAEGRARAFVNDEPVAASLLKRLGALLIEVHGQHADRVLLSSSAHRGLVDAFGGLEAEAGAVASRWRTLKDTEAALASLEAELAAAREEADYLRAAVDELSALDPEPGEEADLAERRQTMSAAEKVADDLSEAASSLDGPRSPIPQMAGVLRKLERKSAGAEDQLAPVMDAIASALDALEEARSTVADARRALDYDPVAMEGLEERLFALRAAARKYKVPVDELAGHAAMMADALADLDRGENRVDALRAEVTAASAAFQAAAAALSEKRAAAADQLEDAIAVELGPLKLGKARFSIAREPAAPSADGIDRMEFIVQTNPGSPPGPLTKVASGGEFSRILLALKVSLADRGSASTMIFDEIDTGVGGAVSDAIGVRMARLSAVVQVVAITHAPQVAARADRHLLIAKTHAGDAATETSITALVGETRREEIARMLAGAKVTDEARAAADRLIDA